MLGYLRIFSLVSLILVIVASVLAGTALRSVTMGELEQIVTRNNATLAQGYINSVWMRYHNILISPTLMESGKWNENPDIARFAQESANYFTQIEALQVNIYTASGRLLISTKNLPTVKEQSGTQLPPAHPVTSADNVLAAMNGPIHELISTDVMQGGVTVPGHVMHSLVPILPGMKDGKPSIDGVVEVYYDVTSQANQLIAIPVMAGGGIIGLFLLLISVLIFIGRKAEGIIAKQHEANVELAAAAAAAQAEMQEKSQFLANVSHELRTPLNAIIGFSEIIKNEFMGQIDNPQYNGYVEDIHAAGLHLLALINDILDFSKAEAGKFEFEVDEMNANKAVANCLRIVATRAETQGVRLNDAMPKEQMVMICDSKRFKQILLNLLSNAIKFTPSGGEVRIAAWQNVMDDTYTFEVRDTGIGIAAKDISRAMTAFGQVDNSLKRKYEGTGLGLPLTKKFIELMGGKFNITSEVNVGTTVTFTLPRIVIEREGVIVKQAA